MTETRATGDLLIKALREVCKATAQLEKLDSDRVLSRQRLDAARASYDHLMEEGSSALLMIDREGNILAANHATATLLGYGSEQLLSMNIRQIYHDDSSREFGPSFRHVLEEGVANIEGLAAVRKDGRGVLVDSFFTAVTYEDKTFVQVRLKQATDRYNVKLGEKRYLQGLELLSRTATDLLELSHGENIYKLLGDYIGKLAGEAYVIISAFDHTSKAFFVKEVTGPERNAEIILGLLLRHLVGTSFFLSQEEFDRCATSCTPVPFSGGLHGLFVDRLPKDVYDAMEDFFLFGCTYIAGLTSDRQIFGMATIFMPKEAQIEHPALVATLMQQAPAVLKHRREESAELPESSPREAETVEGFQHIVAEELPYALEPYTDKLPEATDHATEKAEANPRELRQALGYRKVLVVHNEEIVRDVTGGMLSYMGCKVGYAKNGLEAVARYKSTLETGTPFDAVIIDLSLPGSPDVTDTMKKLKQIHPDAKVVASSATGGNPLARQFKELGFHALILRPYKSEQLAEVLHKVLSTSA